MSTTSPVARPDSRSSDTWPMYGVASTGLAIVLTAIGTFWSPLADYEPVYTWTELRGWLVVTACTVAAAALVFGLVIRGATPATAPRRALVLAILAVPSLVVFWTGLPVVLAGAALCLAVPAWAVSRRAQASVALAVLVLAVAVLAALAG